jgi:uncharacterized protein YqkB
MYLTITSAAKDKLQHIFNNDLSQLALDYNEDIPGANTCAMSGIFTIKQISDEDSYDDSLDSDIGEIAIDSTHRDKLDEQLTLDYKESYNIVQLKARSGIIVERVQFFDKNNQKIA